MVNEKIVTITIKNNDTGEYLLIPVVPEAINYVEGEALPNTVNIVNIGEVDILNGLTLDLISFKSFFPARYDPSYCSTAAPLTPIEYRRKLNGWKADKASLQFICPRAGINKRVYLKAFTWSVEGFEGDIPYEVTFKELRIIKPRKLDAKGKATKTERPTKKKKKPKTYEVKKSDTLAKISKKYGIKDWHKNLYMPNKKVIGNDPNKLKIGQVLRLP